LKDDSTFRVIQTRKLTEVSALAELNGYLQGTTLDSLIQELKANGITRKAFAESLGMSSQYLSAVKSSERRNRYFNELGAIKIACLWVLENFGQAKFEGKDK
jgi:hypothetical protein